MLFLKTTLGTIHSQLSHTIVATSLTSIQCIRKISACPSDESFESPHKRKQLIIIEQEGEKIYCSLSIESHKFGPDTWQFHHSNYTSPTSTLMMMVLFHRQNKMTAVLIFCVLGTVVLANTEILEFFHPLLDYPYMRIPDETVNMNLLSPLQIFTTQQNETCVDHTAIDYFLYSSNDEHQTTSSSSSSSYDDENLLSDGLAWLWFTLASIVTSLVHWYNTSLEANPMFTKSITAGLIGGLGDILAQIFDRGVSSSKSFGNYDPIDVRRICSVAAEGLLISGPLMHLGYETLESYFPIFGEDEDSDLYNPWMMTFCQVFVDMFIMDSFFVATMIIASAFFEGRKHQILEEMKTSYIPAVRVSWLSSLCFLPLQCFTFKYIPLYYRVAAVNFQDIVWNSAISYMSHRSKQQQDCHDSNGEIESEKETLQTARVPSAATAIYQSQG